MYAKKCRCKNKPCFIKSMIFIAFFILSVTTITGNSLNPDYKLHKTKYSINIIDDTLLNKQNIYPIPEFWFPLQEYFV